MVELIQRSSVRPRLLAATTVAAASAGPAELRGVASPREPRKEGRPAISDEPTEERRPDRHAPSMALAIAALLAAVIAASGVAVFAAHDLGAAVWVVLGTAGGVVALGALPMAKGHRRIGAATYAILALAACCVLVVIGHRGIGVANLLTGATALAILTPSSFVRRWLPVGIWAALTSLVVGVAFYELPPPADTLAMAFAVPSGTGADEANMRLDLELADGCATKRPTVHLAVHARRAQYFLASHRSAQPWSDSVDRGAGWHPAWVGGQENDTVAAQEPEIPLQVVRRGLGSCYLRLPQVLGADSNGVWRAARSRLPSGGDRLVLNQGLVVVSTPRANVSLAVVDGFEPVQAGDPAAFWCASQAIEGVGGRQIGCRATLVLTQDWRESFDIVILLVIGALFSVVVEVALRASRPTQS